MNTTLLRLVAPAAAALFALSACTGSDSVADKGADDSTGSSTDSSSNAFPATVETGAQGAKATITLKQKPSSIVSLSPSATEMLYAVGAGDQVKAVDDQSNYPKDAPRTKLSGFQPNVEAILGYEPDLVVTADAPPDMVAGLKKVGVPTLSLPAPADLDGMYDEIERLGEATGHADEADKTVAKVKTDLKKVVADAPKVTGKTYFHELDDTLYTAKGNTLMGQVYGLFGLKNIADKAKGGDYPQLNDEYVVSADPDFIFLSDADCCGMTPAKVAKRPGWDGVSAVKTDSIFAMNADLSSRWSPRVVDFAKQIAADLETAGK